jgi:hypothetical protein
VDKAKRLQEIRARGSMWTAQGNYWLFGTCTYLDGSEVTEEICQRNASKFFNKLDRIILGQKSCASNVRLPRLVYVETGRFRANRHFHFFIKGYDLKQYKQIWSTAERIWPQLIDGAYDCVIKDNLGPTNSRLGYGWKEFDDYDRETVLVECCHVV